ncbi:MAG: radical SAM protein [Prevotella sp.]|nr:radical SAM protein [Prevotella sp.]
MKRYRVNDMFYSLQGEGHNTGRAAVFIRFAGCNLNCAFCDTDFTSSEEMTADEIVQRALLLCNEECGMMVVMTGGEPTLQVDEALVEMFHDAGFEVAMESNGTHLPPTNLDWLTISPKGNFAVHRSQLAIHNCDEVKCVFDGKSEVDDFGIIAKYYYLQPCDVGDVLLNQEIIDQCVDYIKRHPWWRLSLQTHKLAGFK